MFRVRLTIGLALLACMLYWSPNLRADCRPSILTDKELARVTPYIVEKLKSPIALLFDCTLPSIEAPPSEPSLLVVSYSQSTGLHAPGTSVVSRVVCSLGASVNCNDSEAVIRAVSKPDIVLEDDVLHSDLILLLAHLNGEGVIEGDVTSIGYVNPGRTSWSLRKHGYRVTSRVSSTNGLDYVFTYSCSIFRSCKWRERKRSEWFSPCFSVLPGFSVLIDSGCKYDNTPPYKQWPSNF